MELDLHAATDTVVVLIWSVARQHGGLTGNSKQPLGRAPRRSQSGQDTVIGSGWAAVRFTLRAPHGPCTGINVDRTSGLAATLEQAGLKTRSMASMGS